MSTGYPQYMFHREQPSSSGQRLNATDGCELQISDGAMLEVNSGGLIELESGSTMNVKSGGVISVEDGGILNLEGGAQVRESVTAHTSLTKTTLAHTGISSISVATSNVIFTMENPSAAGLTKAIIPLSTKVMYLRSTTELVTNKVHFGTSGKYMLKFTMLAAYKAEQQGVILKSLSTIKWSILAPSTLKLKLEQTTKLTT